jgi:hypothetical protein
MIGNGTERVGQDGVVGGGLGARRRSTRGTPSGMPRMIGRWPDGIRFEDAAVPREGFFRGQEREMCGIWPESSLSTGGRIARRR